MTLLEDAETFLEANGYRVARLDARLLSGTRPSLGDLNDQVLVWVPDAITPEGLRRVEDGYLRRFAEYAEGQSQKFLLIESTEGLSSEFRRRAKGEFRVSVQTPIQFFDAPFKWEVTPTAATAASNLRTGSLRARIPQPSETPGTNTTATDLFEVLAAALRTSSTSGPQVHLVAAPAGFGKSELFRAIFSHQYEAFIDAKRGQTRALRPLALLPEYSASATAPTLKALVTSFLATDIARPLSLESFEWMLTHGYACFMLDGLDEVIARDPHFFEYLYDLLTRGDIARPLRIIVCVRDSLLASNKGLRDFVDDAGDFVAVHHLRPWGLDSIRGYIHSFAKRESAQVISNAVEGSRELQGLAATPFYCRLVVEELEQQGPGVGDGLSSASELMSMSVRRMVLREFEKGLLSQHWAGPEEIESLIQDISEENLEGGSKGVRIEDIAEIALYSLPTDLEPDDLEAAVEQIKQLPFFTSSGDLGRLLFAQEVVDDFLLGTRAVKYFGSNPRRFQQLLGFRSMGRDSVAVRVLKEAIELDAAYDDLFRLALNAAGDPVAFKNMMQIILSSSESSAIVRRLPLERQDLSGLLLEELKLDSVSFRGANLEATRFVGSSLSEAIFSEAVMKDSSFDACVGLDRADFGDLSTFFSAKIGGSHVEDAESFLKIVGVSVGVAPVRAIRPCDAANQLRFLFSKFIRPDGAARRDWLDEKALLSGKRYMDPGTVLRAAVHHGFLSPDPGRARFVRSRGDDYSQMVALVSKLQLSGKIRSLLSEVCREPGCRHLLEIGNDAA